jgi:hypothetical protein
MRGTNGGFTGKDAKNVPTVTETTREMLWLFRHFQLFVIGFGENDSSTTKTAYVKKLTVTCRKDLYLLSCGKIDHCLVLTSEASC